MGNEGPRRCEWRLADREKASSVLLPVLAADLLRRVHSQDAPVGGMLGMLGTALVAGGTLGTGSEGGLGTGRLVGERAVRVRRHRRHKARHASNPRSRSPGQMVAAGGTLGCPEKTCSGARKQEPVIQIQAPGTKRDHPGINPIARR